MKFVDVASDVNECQRMNGIDHHKVKCSATPGGGGEGGGEPRDQHPTQIKHRHLMLGFLCVMSTAAAPKYFLTSGAHLDWMIWYAVWRDIAGEFVDVASDVNECQRMNGIDHHKVKCSATPLFPNVPHR